MSDKKRIRKNRYKQGRPRRLPSLKRPLKIAAVVLAGAGGLFAMSLGLVLMHDTVTQWDYFNATTIRVEGNRHLTRNDVLHQAQISITDNILALNLGMARVRLLAHPWIAEADVVRKLPSTIIISIREHAPLAILNIGRSLLLNENGTIFKETESEEGTDLPTITGLEYADLQHGEAASPTPLGAALDLLRMQTGSRDRNTEFFIKAIDVDRDLGLTIHLNGTVKRVFIGYHGYADKYRKLNDVISYIEKNALLPDIDAIDISNPDRIVARPVIEVSSVQDQKGGSKCREAI